MTTTQPNPRPDEQPRVKISEPGDLIAAIPAMLGFHPYRSLVAICLGGHPTSVLSVMRHDLPGAVLTAGDRFGLEHIAWVCTRMDADAVVAVVVDDRGHPAAEEMTDVVVDLFAASLAEVGVVLAAAHATTAVAAGRPWWGLLGDPRGGVMPDPVASKVAVAQVLRGRAILGSRDELACVLTPLPRRERLRTARLLALARHPTTRQRSDRDQLEYVLTRIAAMESTGHLTDEEIVSVSVALERMPVRDAVLGLAITPAADGAEQTWIRLARALQGRARAEPAALLGFSAYARGNGPLAGVALGAALEADPGHRLAGLLDTALAHGLHPDALGELAATGRAGAAALGVTLPPERRD